MSDVLELTEYHIRRLDRHDRSRLAKKAKGEKEAIRLRICRERFVG